MAHVDVIRRRAKRASPLTENAVMVQAVLALAREAIRHD